MHEFEVPYEIFPRGSSNASYKSVWRTTATSVEAAMTYVTLRLRDRYPGSDVSVGFPKGYQPPIWNYNAMSFPT